MRATCFLLTSSNAKNQQTGTHKTGVAIGFFQGGEENLHTTYGDNVRPGGRRKPGRRCRLSRPTHPFTTNFDGTYAGYRSAGSRQRSTKHQEKRSTYLCKNVHTICSLHCEVGEYVVSAEQVAVLVSAVNETTWRMGGMRAVTSSVSSLVIQHPRGTIRASARDTILLCGAW